MTHQPHAEQAPASLITQQACVSERRTEPQAHVGGLSDGAREEAIRRAGLVIERHMTAYRALEQVHLLTHCFADIGEADRQLRMANLARELMESLIAGRSRDQVLRMEIKRGLI